MNLLIVESGAKARTIQKYLGDDFLVRACRGHIQDLPTTGEEGRKAWWASRDEQHLPEPPWEWTDDSEEHVLEILEEARRHGVERVFVATDPDREGEFIAWRFAEILADRYDLHRITFNEITEAAVRDALANPGPVDSDLVEAALLRRFMDRLVGYRGSSFARSWFRTTTSMGRVQTPSLGFLVERELEREAFVPIPYFRVLADAEGIPYEVLFHDERDGNAWVDSEGRFYPDRTHDAQLAGPALEALQRMPELVVTRVERGSYARNPKAPFTTDALLASAGSELGWSPKRTMAVASRLYEDGHVTYIRTDSTRISEEALGRIRELIAGRWGEDHLGPGAAQPSFGTIQDAHEAIRPSRPEVDVPDGLEEEDHERLYRLIWARFTASQMSPARYEKAELEARVRADRDDVGAMGYERPLRGTARWRVHAGWEAAYEGLREAPPERPPSEALVVGAVHPLEPRTNDVENPRLIEDETKPSARYRQHTLIKKMKEAGIGRPSTYAQTVERLLDREYCREEGRELVPTDKGRILWLEIVPFYAPGDDDEGPPVNRGSGAAAGHGRTHVFSSEFTADMEEMLDGIEQGRRDPAPEWAEFRDAFRAMHDVALERKRRRPTPKQLALAKSLLDAVDETLRLDLLGGLQVDRLEELSGDEISELIGQLQEETDGKRAPSDRQLELLSDLIRQVEMTEEAAAGLVGAAEFSELTGGRNGSASVLIERLLEEAQAGPSEKQLAYLEDLLTEAGLDEAEACALAEASSFAELTGGSDGTASQLIGLLKQRAGG